MLFDILRKDLTEESGPHIQGSFIKIKIRRVQTMLHFLIRIVATKPYHYIAPL
jgi:hypothetical protein